MSDRTVANRRSGNNPAPESCDRCHEREGRYIDGGVVVCGVCYGAEPEPNPRELAPEVLAHLPEYLRDYSPEVADDMADRRGLRRSPQAVAEVAAILERILQDAGLDVQRVREIVGNLTGEPTMNKVAIKEITSEAATDISRQEEPDYVGPYRLFVNVKVAADSHEEAVQIVERRLDGNESAEE